MDNGTNSCCRISNRQRSIGRTGSEHQLHAKSDNEKLNLQATGYGLPHISQKGTGYKIISLMAEHKINADTLAEILDIKDRSSVYRWMNGSRFPSVHNLLHMAMLFGVPMESIIAVEGESRNE